MQLFGFGGCAASMELSTLPIVEVRSADTGMNNLSSALDLLSVHFSGADDRSTDDQAMASSPQRLAHVGRQIDFVRHTLCSA